MPLMASMNPTNPHLTALQGNVSTSQSASDSPGATNTATQPAQGASQNAAPEQKNSTMPKAPTLSLPKGGGAIHGMGEKFDVAASTGTSNASIPIRVSPGRGDLHPNLQLSYSSGAGNGPFGLGWHLGNPSITRKTDKGLPKYMDSGPDADADVFLMSDAEDLVPVFERNSEGAVVLRADGTPVVEETTRGGYRVRRYMPRIEGSFLRIERWVNGTDGNDIYWRVISPHNVTSVYGKNDNSRIFNPSTGPDGVKCIFSWLLNESFDDQGNAMVFRYKAEDSANVDAAQPHEANRSSIVRSANRYLKSIQYGNRSPNRDLNTWVSTSASDLPDSTWLFSLVFDYGEHDLDNPAPTESGLWLCRQDPFSTFRSCFEIRTYRLCRRILLFHNFAELGSSALLVSSTDLGYQENATATYLTQCTAAGYAPSGEAGQKYVKRTIPPVQYEYTEFPTDGQLAQVVVQEIDSASLENVPIGIDGSTYQWVDLFSEGLSGIFTEQGDNWYYKRNTSANNVQEQPSVRPDSYDEAIVKPRLGALQVLERRPSASTTTGQSRFGDVSGDGHLDLIEMQPGSWGFFEKTDEDGWTGFRTFQSFPNISNKDFKLVDLTGDGLTDILIADDQIYFWCPSLGDDGYGEPRTVIQTSDENDGPVSIFSDTEQTIYLADMTGDGLSDLLRIRNGDVCYWPNTGYGRFGSMTTMDNAPWFESIDIFVVKKVHLADIDGSGTTDLIYIHAGGVNIYLNQAGNGFSDCKRIDSFPEADGLSSINVVDLLGNGTMCIAWSTQLPQSSASLKYIDITRGKKPHLLTKVVNNLGSETTIHYAPSTKFYLQDKENGRPWITRLPFPVQCVEKVEIVDRISGNRLVSRYYYHDGFFDGLEREFRGFAMVEQWDTDDFASMSKVDSTNVDSSWHVPPSHAKTWYHTGVYIDNKKISKQWAHQYFGAPANPEDKKANHVFLSTLLDDTVLPDAQLLGGDELREACRALKGHTLRVEVYSDDGSDKAHVPYSVSESNYTIEVVQPLQDANLHSVYMVHPREKIEHFYERVVEDPRIQHDMTLQVDPFGNVLKSIKIAYGRQPGKSQLTGRDKQRQEMTLFLYTENDVTNKIDSPDDYRLPTPYETRGFELSGLQPLQGSRFQLSDFNIQNFTPINSLSEIPFEQKNDYGTKQKRLIQQSRTLFRSDDLTSFLPAGQMEAGAITGCVYRLCFTPGLLSNVFQRQYMSQPVENLLPDPKSMLEGTGEQQAGYVDLDQDGHWWKQSGLVFYHPNPAATASQELAEARAHFFMPRHFMDPFGNNTFVNFDVYTLFPISTQDAVGNTTKVAMDYRILAPSVLTDANGNRNSAAYDALGYVVGTAIMGKVSENFGDSLAGFKANLTQDEMDQFFADPKGNAATTLLGNATSRIVYDSTRYWRDTSKKLPVYTATIVRETHASDLKAKETSKMQINFGYSDGFGRIIQRKMQTKAGSLTDNGPVASDRWIGSGWTIYNNKGKPVRQYEPFFDDTHEYKFNLIKGVSPIIFYDPLLRIVGTLRPDKTLEKVRFDAWSQTSFDVNDNLLISAPKVDPDIGHYLELLPDYECTPSWYDERVTGKLGPDEQAAALKARAHANTPTMAQLDVLGRIISNTRDNGPDGLLTTRSTIDILGNQYEAFDANDRLVMKYDFDMCGTRIHQASIDSGERWILPDVTGHILFSWSSRNFRHRSVFDPNRRLVSSYWREGTADEVMVGHYVYGETVADAESHNLRAKVLQVRDQAGTLTTREYDFKGNLLRSERRFAQNYKTVLDWFHDDVPLEGETSTSTTTYDALNRIVESTTPDKSITYHVYNESGQLEQVLVNLRGGQPSADTSTWTPFVTGTDYNARNQMTLLSYGNGVKTNRSYDPYVFRLQRIQTVSSAPGQQALQDLNYTYDPIGNVSNVRDKAQQSVYFRNARVDPSSDYSYDAVYRLKTASGREHLGQNNQPNIATAIDDYNTGLPHPGDGNAMASYIESYSYDATNNMTQIRHGGSDASKPGWTRNFNYDAISNRLQSTTTGQNTTEIYSYDGNAGLHGNMTKMPTLSQLSWDFLDQLQSVSQQIVNSGTPETTYYVYDILGQRARKVTERQAAAGQAPTKLKERYYIGLSEMYREYAGDGTTISLEREALSIIGAAGRVAIIETRTQGQDQSPLRLSRYQFSNNIGSAVLELDQGAQIISYEEYTPYGNTSYQAVASQLDVPKRYRYSGKERDDESGLYYHGARYYAPWISRWISPDPIGIKDGFNLYEHVSSNPVKLVDPTGHAGANGEPPPNHDATLLQVPAILTRRVEGILASNNLAQLLRSKGAIIKEEVVAKWGLGGSRLDALSKVRSMESKLLDISRYKDAAGNIDTKKVEATLTRYFKQVAKHEAAIKDAIKEGKEAFNGFEEVSKETLVFTLKGLKEGSNELAEFRKIARDFAKVKDAATGLRKGPLIGIISEANPLLQKAAAIAKEESQAAKILPALQKTTSLAGKLGAVAAPLKKLGPLGSAISAVSDASTLLSSTAKTDDKIHAGLDLVSTGLMESGNPIAEAAGAGIAVGNALEEHLNVSEYSSAAGMKANEFLKAHGASGDTALVAGAVVTVLATPAAIGYAAIEKVKSWF